MHSKAGMKFTIFSAALHACSTVHAACKHVGKLARLQDVMCDARPAAGDAPRRIVSLGRQRVTASAAALGSSDVLINYLPLVRKKKRKKDC